MTLPAKHPINLVAWFLIWGAIVLIGLSAWLLWSTDQAMKRCEEVGGLYIRSSRGYDCIRAETIEVVPQIEERE